MSDLLGRAEALVARSLRAGAAQAEVYLESSSGIDAEVEGGRIQQAGSDRSEGGAIRVIKDGRVGFATFTGRPEGAIDRALRASRAAPKNAYTLPDTARLGFVPGRFDAETAEAEADAVLLLLQEAMGGAKEVAPGAVVVGGGAGVGRFEVAIASSQGAAAAQQESSVSCSVSLVLDDGGTVTAHEARESWHLDLDASEIGRVAAARALSLRRPRPSDGGVMDIVLRPPVVSELVVEPSVGAAVGDDALRGRSFFSDRLGQPVAHAGLWLADEPRADDAIAWSPFDGEGLATTRRPILDGGVLRGYLFDSWDAFRHAKRSTASGVRASFRARPVAGSHMVRLGHKHTQGLDGLVAGVDRGLLVDHVLGAHTQNDVTGAFSVTAPAVWQIEKGAITGPVKEVALAGTVPGLLAKADGASQEVERDAGAIVPHLRIRDVNVSA